MGASLGVYDYISQHVREGPIRHRCNSEIRCYPGFCDSCRIHTVCRCVLACRCVDVCYFFVVLLCLPIFFFSLRHILLTSLYLSTRCFHPWRLTFLEKMEQMCWIKIRTRHTSDTRKPQCKTFLDTSFTR